MARRGDGAHGSAAPRNVSRGLARGRKHRTAHGDDGGRSAARRRRGNAPRPGARRFQRRGAGRGQPRDRARAAPRLDRSAQAERRARHRNPPAVISPPPFAPAPWLTHPHLQTTYASLFARAPQVEYRRERWETPDGDFVDVDFVDGIPGATSVPLFHGLEGSSRSHYARMLMHRVHSRGWNGSVLNFRGCSGEPNRLPRAYHSGDSEEVDWVLRRLKDRLGDFSLFAVGGSLCGNSVLKWLGERGDGAGELVERAAAVSAPMDLIARGHALRPRPATLYARHLLATLQWHNSRK